MEQFSGFHDVSSGYWAAEYIKYAALHGWINGYGDGSFHAEREINRAEVVTIVNRLLGREADEDYIADNLRKLNTFQMSRSAIGHITPSWKPPSSHCRAGRERKLEQVNRIPLRCLIADHPHFYPNLKITQIKEN